VRNAPQPNNFLDFDRIDINQLIAAVNQKKDLLLVVPIVNHTKRVRDKVGSDYVACWSFSPKPPTPSSGSFDDGSME
jgi:hypothetical protein